MKRFLNHVRVLIVRGLLAMIPISISLLVLQLIYIFIDQRVMNLVDRFIGYRIPGLGILLVLIFLYMTGILVSSVIGKTFFHIIEAIFTRIPILKTTYQIGKQLSSTFSLSEKQVFQQTVLFNLRPGVSAIGFITGTLTDKKSNKKFYKIFVPMVPNPTSGFVFIVPESEIVDPHWTVEEAMGAIITGGIISPETVNAEGGTSP